MTEQAGFLKKPEWTSDAIVKAKAMDARSSHFLPKFLLTYCSQKIARRLCLFLCKKFEGGQFYSQTWRALLSRYYGVSIGAYTYGPIMRPGAVPSGFSIGNYCSVGGRLIIRRRNHPSERFSQHPFFYNRKLGYLKQDAINKDEENPLTIGHDVWIGDRVTILSKCQTIGNGAIIAAGSVVTKDVPAYSIIAGVPAKPIGQRFDESIIDRLEKSRWWEKSLSELLELEDNLLVELNSDILDQLGY